MDALLGAATADPVPGCGVVDDVDEGFAFWHQGQHLGSLSAGKAEMEEDRYFKKELLTKRTAIVNACRVSDQRVGTAAGIITARAGTWFRKAA